MPPEEALAAVDKERVRRLVALPEVRAESVERLQAARVAIVGMGGLGNPCALYLAAQGIGHLTLIDPDVVEAHNLGRQILYGPQDVGRAKVDAARDSLVRVQPHAAVRVFADTLAADNIERLLFGHDIVLDGLDSGATREVLNAWAVASSTPVLFAGAIGYEAQVFGVREGGPCLSCLWGSVADRGQDCAQEGILGPVAGMAGMIQAQETLKFLLGVGTQVWGKLWTYDGYRLQSRTLTVPQRGDCAVCANGWGHARKGKG